MASRNEQHKYMILLIRSSMTSFSTHMEWRKPVCLSLVIRLSVLLYYSLSYIVWNKGKLVLTNWNRDVPQREAQRQQLIDEIRATTTQIPEEWM